MPTLTKNELARFLAQFVNESDRASVILATAMLENELHSLLVAYLAPAPSSNDDLFSGAYSPLGSFKPKIDLACRLGLISHRLARDLQIVRRLRNEFAHDPAGSSLSHASARDRLNELCRSLNLDSVRHSLRRSNRDDHKSHAMVVFALLLLRLRKATHDVNRIAPHPEERIYDLGHWDADIPDQDDLFDHL